MRIIGCVWVGVAGGSRKLVVHFTICTLTYTLRDKIKEGDMGRTCSTERSNKKLAENFNQETLKSKINK
jgi:hypothetical protein